MDEHRMDALQYGHLGTAEYLPEACSWKFPRTIARTSSISYVGVTRRTVPPSINSTPAISSEDRNQRSSLVNAHPDLAAASFLDRTEALSRVIIATTNTCDPRVSSLFDLGNAVDLENDASGTRTVPIAVVASGRCGNSISFFKVEDEMVEWRRTRSYRARVPSIGNSDATIWAGCGTPVRQICFARTTEVKATWMAARFSMSTTIFRPLYHRIPVPTRHYDEQDILPPLRNSRLNANPLVDISCSQTGGYPHADVTFNPWYQRQLAIVDERGNWSIWNISGRQRRSKGNWLADCVKSGSLPLLDSGTKEGYEQPHHDGWSSIEWVADVNSLIVCDRRRIILYRIENDSVLALPIELGLKRNSEWILDMKRSPSNVSYVFVLTTSRIFWLDIASSGLSSSERDYNRPLSPRLSWRHFRDPEDITLRLSPFQISDAFFLLLYSRLNALTQVFQFPLSFEERGEPAFVPDPFIVQIPSPSPDTSSESRSPSYDARFAAIMFKEVEHGPPSGNKDFYDSSLRLIKLFTLDFHLALHESLYTGTRNDGYMQEEGIRLGRDILRLKKRAIVARRSRTAAGGDDDFVVDDWDESVSHGAFKLVDSQPSSAQAFMTSQWTVDYALIYSVFVRKQMANARIVNVEQLPERGFGDCLAELDQNLFITAFSGSTTSKTLLESANCSPFLDEIDENTRDFERLKAVIIRQGPDDQSQSRPRLLPLSLSYASSRNHASWGERPVTLGVVEIYNHLVRDWLSVLPNHIPGRTRIAKERMIRNIAAEISLARVNLVRSAETLMYDLTDDERLIASKEAEIPVQLNTTGLFQGTVGIKYSSLSFGTHRDYEPENAEPASSHAEASPAAGNLTSMQRYKPGLLYAGLCSLTTVEEPRMLPKNVANMLSHWSAGSDPTTYDWQKTVQELEKKELRIWDKSAKPKLRARKRPPRSISQDASVRIPTPLTVPVIRQWGSQPQADPPAIRLQSSQVTEENLPMTQVERGIYGGRERGRKKIAKARKKRAAGF